MSTCEHISEAGHSAHIAANNSNGLLHCNASQVLTEIRQNYGGMHYVLRGRIVTSRCFGFHCFVAMVPEQKSSISSI